MFQSHSAPTNVIKPTHEVPFHWCPVKAFVLAQSEHRRLDCRPCPLLRRVVIDPPSVQQLRHPPGGYLHV
ncbi:unnamed protein product (mitochondrion) [Plasmodiophora brassicae]|uniref:Uncharacterized protein n=1 Tax=Plasmodiophora brassicae TaxID=37360 RepID=A0A3P3YA12_PLABS|nr:unnamed protein product [Plasmodiophora brassicae]